MGLCLAGTGVVPSARGKFTCAYQQSGLLAGCRGCASCTAAKATETGLEPMAVSCVLFGGGGVLEKSAQALAQGAWVVRLDSRFIWPRI
jgi:hypothetical protein